MKFRLHNARGAVWRKVTANDADFEGTYTITWRPNLSWEGHKVSLADGGARAVVTVWALDNTPDYMGGSEIPKGILSLRSVPAGL